MSRPSASTPSDDAAQVRRREVWESTPRALVEGRDFTLDRATGGMVFTRAYLLERGFCCRFGCRHCPYGEGCP